MDVFVWTGALPKRCSPLAFRDALVDFIVDSDSPFLMVFLMYFVRFLFFSDQVCYVDKLHYLIAPQRRFLLNIRRRSKNFARNTPL
jgi:hypothetical protein